MLKKINRITSKKEFDFIKRHGIVKQYPYFGLVSNLPKLDKNPSPRSCGVLPLTGEIDKKFGFVISKKISKKAVVRNKIRRKLAEEVRKNLDKFENGFRGIFLVKKNILDEKGNIKTFKIL